MFVGGKKTTTKLKKTVLTNKSESVFISKILKDLFSTNTGFLLLNHLEQKANALKKLKNYNVKALKQTKTKIKVKSTFKLKCRVKTLKN